MSIEDPLERVETEQLLEVRRPAWRTCLHQHISALKDEIDADSDSVLPHCSAPGGWSNWLGAQLLAN